ncbi:hypothetical protein EX30DRAFT_396396 [Ascodesmis nigricans]|uniref:Uncharacterized protein n=1 Tax=Ascodesmis nigricans TaxID=341454 RepID=A0A4S2MV69_9PEZI|nr:hypothetical protein EX30DRAFT_396396 [Ascodesmis nigricans]
MQAYGRRPRSQSRGRRVSQGYALHDPHRAPIRPADPFQYLDPVPPPPPPPIPGQFPEDHEYPSEYYNRSDRRQARSRSRSQSRQRRNSYGNHLKHDPTFNDVPPPPRMSGAAVGKTYPVPPPPEQSQRPSIWRRFSSLVAPSPGVAQAPAPSPHNLHLDHHQRGQLILQNHQNPNNHFTYPRSLSPPEQQNGRSSSLKRPSSRTRRAYSDSYSNHPHIPVREIPLIPAPTPPTAPHHPEAVPGGGWKLPIPNLSIPNIPIPSIPLPQIPVPSFSHLIGRREPRPPSPPPQLTSSAAHFVYAMTVVAEEQDKFPQDIGRMLWARSQVDGLVEALEKEDVESLRKALVWVKRERFVLNKEPGLGAKVGVVGKAACIVELLAKGYVEGYTPPGYWVD